MTVKRVRAPQPLERRALRGSGPDPEQPLALDLLAGDWVAPHGRGSTADLTWQRRCEPLVPRAADERAPPERAAAASHAGRVCRAELRFLRPGDGLQFRPIAPLVTAGHSARSELLSDHEAPEDGYVAVWTVDLAPGASVPHTAGHTAYLRFRTRLDGAGRVVEARYGKIEDTGPGILVARALRFHYEFNPTGGRALEPAQDAATAAPRGRTQAGR